MSTVDSISYSAELQAAHQQIAQLTRENQKISEQFEDQTTFLELFTIMQRVSAKKVSYAHQKLYLALVELYPGLLSGIPTVVIPFKVREAAGWPHKNTAGGFFTAMQAFGAISYELQPFNGNAESDEGKRPALITPNPEVFPYPRDFDLVSTDKLSKAREADRKKKQEMAAAWRLYQCDKCGSPDIKYDLIPVCNSCGYRHTPMEAIDGNRITVTPVGETDNWDEMAEDYGTDNITDFSTEPELNFDVFGPKVRRS